MKQMKFRLFLVRHADYSGNRENPFLSDAGKIQAERLALVISRILGEESAELWSSTANRASQTADILKENILPNISSEIDFKAGLWCDEYHKHDFAWLKSELDGFKGENLIIVSHLDYVQEFPATLGLPYNNASYASGVLIEDRIQTYISGL